MKRLKDTRSRVTKFIDSVVSAISPKMGAERQYNRAMMSGFTGASKSRNSMKFYSPTNSSPNQVNLEDRETLISRANDLDRNNEIAVGARLKSVASVIGSGLNHKSKINPLELGITPEEADKIEKQLETIWKSWSGSEYASSEMGMNFHQLIAIAYNDSFIDGDCLLVEKYIPTRGIRRGAQLGTAYQLVRGARICNKGYACDTETKVAGVNLDSNGVAVSYDVLNGDPGEYRDYNKSYSWALVKAFHQNGNRKAKLLFKKERTGEYRGIPRLSRVIEALKQITDYSSNVSASSVLFSMFTAFVETQQATGLSTVNESLEGEQASLKGDEQAMGAGSFVNLAPGDSVKMAQFAKNSQEFDIFFATLMKKVGMAVGIPYQVLLSHFSSSYSSARAEILEAHKTFSQQAKVWGSVYQMAYQAVVLDAHARGLVNLEGILTDPAKKAAYLRSEWTGLSMIQIDPLRGAKASVILMESGLSTGEREASETNGSDYNDNLRVRGQERKEAEKQGVPLIATVGDEPPINDGGQ